ncbi:hypothetical protein O6H91_15G054000 [Diphasiastrum complanatum]|uniref:Uncharacterized protein n=1 Tax=Diphasiastrum complanatum TaxID=34168 RepID=A0ACC2BIG2_DIPCM|nr:hypothetical protein O6H91_15G054000 [Diphasiastrum complanatum]
MNVKSDFTGVLFVKNVKATLRTHAAGFSSQAIFAQIFEQSIVFCFAEQISFDMIRQLIMRIAMNLILHLSLARRELLKLALEAEVSDQDCFCICSWDSLDTIEGFIQFSPLRQEGLSQLRQFNRGTSI